ncbi:hypothetical protein JW905_13615 [bacterium]|nr:hypothetical protein [candidate division CSSED10-310 bacterium]
METSTHSLKICVRGIPMIRFFLGLILFFPVGVTADEEEAVFDEPGPAEETAAFDDEVTVPPVPVDMSITAQESAFDAGAAVVAQLPGEPVELNPWPPAAILAMIPLLLLAHPFITSRRESGPADGRKRP